MNVNKIILSGNVVRDMEVVALKSTVLGNITIANNRGYGDNEKTNFIRCTIFGEKRVEALEKMLVTGTGVIVTGELEVTTKETEDGWVTYTNVIVDDLEITRFKNTEEEEEKSKKKSKYKK